MIEVVSDDMPFLVDSVTMELARQGYGDRADRPSGDARRARRRRRAARGARARRRRPLDASTESVIHVEVARQADPERLAVLHSGIELVLEEVRAAVEDWAAMRATHHRAGHRAAPPGAAVRPHELAEAQAFLAWLADEHFTFLGYREYD